MYEPTCGVGSQVHAAGHQVRRGDAVGERVVDLAHHRDPVVGQALDEVHLPQRAVPVQRGAGDLPDRLVQLAATARGGQLEGPDVVVEIDVAVLPPHRMVELERDVDQLVAQRHQLVHPAGDDLAKRVDVESATVFVEFDDRDLDGVHVHVRRFAVQQHRIPAAQPFHRCPLPHRGDLTQRRAAQITSFAPIGALLRWTWLRNSDVACAATPARSPSMRSKPCPAPGNSR